MRRTVQINQADKAENNKTQYMPLFCLLQLPLSLHLLLPPPVQQKRSHEFPKCRKESKLKPVSWHFKSNNSYIPYVAFHARSLREKSTSQR
jgi:hypothetical protein